MKRVVIALVMALATLPAFACGEFALNEKDGTGVFGETYTYETQCFDCEVYLDTNYPELSSEDKDEIIDVMSEWLSFDDKSSDDRTYFYDVLKMLADMKSQVNS